MEGYCEKNFQEEIVSHFIKKGWKKIKINNNACIDEALLKKSLYQYLINKYSIDKNEMNEIYNIINKDLSSNWFLNNKIGFLRIIKNGISTKFTEKNKKLPYKIIDFKNYQNNIYEIAEEVWITSGSRTDLTIFINGLPIFIFELKSVMNDEVTLKEAFHQIKGYLETDNPKFATFNIAQIVAKNFNKAKMGSIGTSSLDDWHNVTSNKENHNSFFEIFHKNKILNYLKWGVLFSKIDNQKNKYILRHHQYDAVFNMQNAILKRKSGYIWHTQGSGKTITISALLSSLKFNDNLISITTIIDVDRIDLSTNMYKTLDKIAPEHFDCTDIKKANSRNDLKNYLKERQYKGIIVTTTQKFDNWNKISDRKNLIIISDEAHRTHSTEDALNSKQTYLEKINKALPNALKYGFTATPIFETDKSTYAMFGKCIHQYTMKQAEIDDIIVPIQVHIVNLPLKIKNVKGNSLSNIKKITKRKEIIYRSVDRLEFITNKIKEKFISEKNHHKVFGNNDTFKAMVVTNSKKQGFDIYQLLKKKIFNNDPNSIHFIADDTYRKDSQVHKYLKENSKNKRNWINNFQNPKTEIEMIVVVDMLLTGYDVPNLRLMFFDKEIQKHNLLQAITRVNRKFEKKPIGTVFSFRDIKSKLQETLKVYRDTTKDHSNLIKTSINAEKSIKYLVQKIHKTYNFDMTKIDFKEILWKSNDIKMQFGEKKDFIRWITDINNLSTLVIKWSDKNLQKVALLCKLVLKTKQMSSPSFIDISEEEFNKLLNATEVNKKLVREVIYTDLDEILSLKINDKKLIFTVSKEKITIAIKKETSFSKEEKQTLLEQLKKIIEQYNLENFDVIKSKLHNFYSEISKYEKLNEYTKLIFLEAKQTIKRKFNTETLNNINKIFVETGERWKQNPATHKMIKRKIRDTIINNEKNIEKNKINVIISSGFNRIEKRGNYGY